MIPSHKWRMTMDGAQRCRPSMQRRARLDTQGVIGVLTSLSISAILDCARHG
jgi:hypothetical protein